MRHSHDAVLAFGIQVTHSEVLTPGSLLQGTGPVEPSRRCLSHACGGWAASGDMGKWLESRLLLPQFPLAFDCCRVVPPLRMAWTKPNGRFQGGDKTDLRSQRCHW